MSMDNRLSDFSIQDLQNKPRGLIEPDFEEPPAPAPPPPKPPKRERTFPRYYAWLILLGLTIFGGFIRFYWINDPACWNDEAHVFRRITCSFEEMADYLRRDDFGPLHFELYWALAHWKAAPLSKIVRDIAHGELLYEDFFDDKAATFTPFWMRLMPSLAGTLMIPVMYFLARQLCSRKTSLLVAAFTACSAYLMVYAHDGKMYMHFWLFCALTFACLLWWFRSGLRVAWLAWIASGLAMVGTQGPGAILLALQPIFAFTQPRFYWKKFILFVIGLGMIGASPGLYYTLFNPWTDRVGENFGAAGLGWLPPVLRGRSGPELLLFVTSDYVCSWEWPYLGYDPAAQARKPEPGDVRGAQSFMATGFSRMLQGWQIDPRVVSALMLAVVIILLGALVGIFPWPRRWRGATLDDPPTAPWWQTVLWLSIWLVLPAYGYHSASMKAMTGSFTGPSDWYASITGFLASIVNALPSSGPGGLLKAHPIVCVAIAFMILGGIFLSWKYLPAIVGGMFALLLVSLLVAAAYRANVHRLIWSGLKIVMTGLFNPRGVDRVLGAVDWRIAPDFGSRLEGSVLTPRVLVVALLVLPPLAWYYCGRNVWERFVRTGQLVLVVAAMYGLCAAAEALLRRHLPEGVGPVWMSRFVGLVFPAFAIAACALIARVPFRALRWTLIAVLLWTNLAQAYGRMFMGSEPRVDLMMRDVVAGDDFNSTTLTFVQGGPETAHPAGGTVENRPGKYYASLYTGRLFSNRDPDHFLGAPVTELLKTGRIRRYSDPSMVASEARRSDRAQRIIVWDRVLEIPYKSAPDEVLGALGQGWSAAGKVEYYPVRYHWNWSSIYISRRREYVRAAGTVR